MNADQALRLLGRYSRWQIENYLAFAMGFSIPFAWMAMSVVYVGDTPNYRCAVPPNATINDTIPLVDDGSGVLVYDQCHQYVNRSVDNTTTSCQHGYWYDPESGYDSTLTTEWDLVCGEEWLVELSMTLSGVGAVVGAVLFNKLADMYGRKTIFLWCLYSNIVVALAMTFSPNMVFFVVLSFVDGMQQQGCMAASFILAVELFPVEHRTFAGNAVEFFWVFGYMSCVLIAYFIRNWRWLMLAITLPLLATISFYWIISESVPWLLTQGRVKEAEAIMRRAAKRNKITLPERLFDDQLPGGTELTLYEKDSDAEDEEEMHNSSENVSKKKQYSYSNLNTLADADNHNDTEKAAEVAALNQESPAADGGDEAMIGSITNIDQIKYGLLDLMRSPFIRRFILFFVPIWFVNSLGYYATSLTVTYLPGDRYLNSFLYALVEVPAYTLCWVLSLKIGRRLPLVGFNVIGGVALCLTTLQAFEFEADISWLVIIFSLIGKTGITASFALIFVIGPELFPTNARNLGMGICQSFSRTATIIAPFARTVSRSLPWLPMLLFGVLSIIVGFMGLAIPETRDTKLPDTIEEIEAWKKPKRKQKPKI